MPTGGSRNRSGPQPNPQSGRSDARGLQFAPLPAEGYQGEAPAFPLMPMVIGDGLEDDLGEDRTIVFREREAELWAWAWTTPQATAWINEPWRWQAVAQWVRTSVICETADAKAADRGSLHRFADQIGLTPAGLRENGWVITSMAKPTSTTPEPPKEPVRRLRAV